MLKTKGNTVFEPQRPHKFVRALRSKKMKYSTSKDQRIEVLKLKIG